MGQVYQATDTKLNRQVALKILPEAFASDPDRLSRFQREAQVLASLNHPGIAAIYGIEEADDTRALVLELVEGPTLADRIAQGPIPVDEALPIAKQIAEALEAAHEAGVVHRDLKPANIKVREDGTVKVLDFGLAKALEPNPTGDQSQSPTLTAAATQMGVIMGTAAYMSPEQAAGKPVDKRSDIWSFGVILFEMLTGQRMFTGETVSHVLGAVLQLEPEWKTLPTTTPTSVVKLLYRCLDKDRRERLQHIGDARVELRDALSQPPAVQAAPRSSVPWQKATPWLGGVAVGVLATSVALWSVRPDTTQPTLRKFTLPIFATQGEQSLAVSPDGQMVAYTHDRRLWIQHVDQLEPVEIVDSDVSRFPFWSPDSSSVGYVAGGTLKKVSADGGTGRILCAVPGEFQGATWGGNGTIIFGQTELGLKEVSEEGGEPETFVTPETMNVGKFSFPQLLPDGESLLYFAAGSGEVVVQSGDAITHIASEVDIYGLTYSPSGHILYRRGFPFSEGIWAVPFSLTSLTTSGEPFLAAANGSLPTVSQEGTQVYAVFEGTQRLVWIDRRGEVEGTIGATQGQIWEPTRSPDGRLVAVQGHDQNSIDIYVHDVLRGTKTRVTQDPALDDEPTWSPTGDQIAFTSLRNNGQHDIFLQTLDGSGEAEILVTGPGQEHAPNWSRDGKFLAYHSVDPQGGTRDLWYLDLANDGTPVSFLETRFEELVPQISPDSRYVAYQSDEQGQWDDLYGASRVPKASNWFP